LSNHYALLIIFTFFSHVYFLKRNNHFIIFDAIWHHEATFKKKTKKNNHWSQQPNDTRHYKTAKDHANITQIEICGHQKFNSHLTSGDHKVFHTSSMDI
jgi:hypothetical protein